MAGLTADRAAELEIFDSNVRHKQQLLSIGEELERAAQNPSREDTDNRFLRSPRCSLTASASSLLCTSQGSVTYPDLNSPCVRCCSPAAFELTMVNSKPIEFGGNLGENVDHFLRGFSLAFASEEAKLEAGAVPESSESKAYRIITHSRPKSEAARFVSRLPPQTTQDYTALSQALRGRFENSAELEEEQRYAEELFLSLRQRRGQSIDDYIRLTRRVARGMTAENQHLVATQFVKGLDSRELRVQTMSGL